MSNTILETLDALVAPFHGRRVVISYGEINYGFPTREERDACQRSLFDFARIGSYTKDYSGWGLTIELKNVTEDKQ